MAGRPKQVKADIKALRKISQNGVDTRPLVAYVMRKCGCTFAEIAEVFDITRQMAETLVKATEKKL